MVNEACGRIIAFWLPARRAGAPNRKCRKTEHESRDDQRPMHTRHDDAARGNARRRHIVGAQLAARRLILLSASVVSFLSVAFSSSSVLASRFAQSLRPSCFAQAIRLP